MTFEVPTSQQELFEPLERVRKVVRQLLTLMPKYAPRRGWAQEFYIFRLPNGLAARHRPELQRVFRDGVVRMATQARVSDVNLAVKEFEQLVPMAERCFQNGCSTREAWGRAAKAYSELKLGRGLVDLFLACLHSTGDTERSLKDVAFHHCALRSSLAPESVEDRVLVAIHGPEPEEIAKCETLPGGASRVVPIGSYLPKAGS